MKRAFGANVQAERQERDWSQERLADEVGTYSQNVARIERGTDNLTLDTMCRVADALSSDVLVLLGQRRK